MALPKLKPYAPGAGFDNMLFVAQEQSRLNNLAQLALKQLSKIFEMVD